MPVNQVTAGNPTYKSCIKCLYGQDDNGIQCELLTQFLREKTANEQDSNKYLVNAAWGLMHECAENCIEYKLEE